MLYDKNMERKTVLLIVAIAVISIVCLLLLYFRFSAGKTPTSKFSISNPSNIEELNIRMEQVEKAMAKLITQIGADSASPAQVQTTTNSTLEARMNNLESAMASLTVTVNQLKTSSNQSSSTTTTAQTSTNSNQPPLYIPLGWNGSSNSTTWSSVTTQTFTLDPTDYPGMTSVQFTASILIYQGNGTAYAQLYNSTDGNAVYGSSLSTTSQNYSSVSSNNFQVPAAEKTYVLQLMSNTGYASMVQDAWLRINF